MPPEQSKEELRERIESLESENERLRKQQQPSSTRRRLIRAAGVAGAGAISLNAATGSTTAQSSPSGINPAPSDDPFKKLRADRVRFISRTSQPADPASGKAVVWVDDGDLP